MTVPNGSSSALTELNATAVAGKKEKEKKTLKKNQNKQEVHRSPAKRANFKALYIISLLLCKKIVITRSEVFLSSKFVIADACLFEKKF